MKRLVYGFAAWVLLAGLPGPAKAQFDFTTIDVPGATYSLAQGINDAGQIVGSFFDDSGFHGFLLDVDGSYTTLDEPGANQTEPHGINNVGVIAGLYYGPRRHGFLATPN